VSKVDDDDMIPIDEVIEAWLHREPPWWAEAMQCLRLTAEDVSDPPESDPDGQA
jgi:hypothetical protein